MKMPEKQQSIILAMTVIIIIGFGIFRYYPIAKQTQAVKEVENNQKIQSIVAKTQTQQLPMLYDIVKKLRTELADYDNQVPQSRRFAELYQQIADIMGRYDLEEQLIQHDSEIEGQDLNCIPITVQCSGMLSEIFELFKSIQALDRLIQIESVQIRNDADFSGIISVDARIKVFYRSIIEGGI